jgi:hypothetical protein
MIGLFQGMPLYGGGYTDLYVVRCREWTMLGQRRWKFDVHKPIQVRYNPITSGQRLNRQGSWNNVSNSACLITYLSRRDSSSRSSDLH